MSSSPIGQGPLGLPKLEGPDRDEALEAPGASWREWFYFSFLRAWTALGFFIADVWVFSLWDHPLSSAVNVTGLILSLAAAVYLEILAYGWLWYRPNPLKESERTAFRPTALRLRRFGRWTPEAFRARSGADPFPEGVLQGPDPREFL